ncbi:tetratricopeptide repeat protein [uncultured Campylobacter sp.]|jgi:sel1 domain-containing protein repeat-containing protein|uniref:tetratricopeptide repeat protein n=1 Tax=uncultured Campylobacter sp. TaxID=218934 RepID=UPI002601EF7B|nr:tetratricopeptide repeat protein [uncultured Campylobacter sp.]
MKKVILVLVVLSNLAFARMENFSENKKECEGGSVDTCLDYGTTYLFGTNRDYIKAKFFLEKACKKDNVKKEDKLYAFYVREAYFYLGYMYLEGLGVEKDDKKAFELFNTATAYDGKLDELYYSLGRMYFDGNRNGTMRKDEEKGGEYLKKSCDGGYPHACKDLADLYYYRYNNRYSNSDMSEAMQYYKKTCELVKNTDDAEYFQEACDMYELLK